MQISTLCTTCCEAVHCDLFSFHFMKWDEGVRATDAVWTQTVFAVRCRLCRLHTSETFIFITQKRARGRSQENREPRRTSRFYLCARKMWNMRQFLSTVTLAVTNETDGTLILKYFSVLKCQRMSWCLICALVIFIWMRLLQLWVLSTALPTDSTVWVTRSKPPASYCWIQIFSQVFSMWFSGFESFDYRACTPSGLTAVKKKALQQRLDEKRWTFCSRWRPNWKYTTKSVFIQDLLTYSGAVRTAITREKI